MSQGSRVAWRWSEEVVDPFGVLASERFGIGTRELVLVLLLQRGQMKVGAFIVCF